MNNVMALSKHRDRRLIGATEVVGQAGTEDHAVGVDVCAPQAPARLGLHLDGCFAARVAAVRGDQ